MSAVDRTLEPVAEDTSVRGISSSVMGMTIFVASEAVFFAAFFGVYTSSYSAATIWPPKNIPLPALIVPTVGVIVLFLSGLFLTGAVLSMKRDDYPRTTMLWLVATLVGGLGFLVLLLLGYQDVGFGIKDGIYASLFYVVIGLEVAHAVGGLVMMGLVFVRGFSGELALRRDPIQSLVIYWYFVVALGIVIFLVFYTGATL
jgi:cytochrome c oxidase subunit III